MAAEIKLSDSELSALVDKFNAIEPFIEKCRFFHANPALAAIINGIHFPKPEDAKPAANP